MVDRYRICWVAWDVVPPYSHPREVWLTSKQIERFHLLSVSQSLQDACDYAQKVGRAEAVNDGP